MKTSLKTSAFPMSSSFHLPTPPSTFGRGFQQFLASAPAYQDEHSGGRIAQPLRFLEAVPPADHWSFDSTVSHADVTVPLSESLGAAILLSPRPTTKSLALAKAVHALRHG